MFDWFWEFLYMISKTLFRLSDGLIYCANLLCGIEPIEVSGEETDLLSYLLFSSKVSIAFKTAALLATILVVIFSVFMIIRTIGKEKAEGTPVQIGVKAFKTVLMFFLVPAVMIAFVMVGNAFLSAIYDATMQAASSPGAFLFAAFAEDGGMPTDVAEMFRQSEYGYDYRITSDVSREMDLSEFPFLFSWLAGGVVLFGIGSSMLIFVDRVISLAILYIVSPVSISTSVLDDGARFKLWRDQFLSKFIIGYGMLIALNVYSIVCALVIDPNFYFFPDNSFLNFLMKILVIAGGALTMQKSMAIIGNLVAAGAGSNELRDNALSAGRLAKMASSAAGYTVGLPFKAAKSVLGDAISMKSRDWGAKLLDKVGLGLAGGTSDKDGNKDPAGKSKGERNGEKANYGSDPNSAKDAINDSFQLSNWDKKGGDNTNNESPKQDKKDNMVSNSIKGSGNSTNGGDKK